jgi:4a-hydroxytetrahydrobiopterin dehydratase
MSELTQKHCKPCEGGVPKLTPEELQPLIKNIPKWALNKNNTAITRSFSFKDFHLTMAFVNKVADISNHENHHPDMKVGYDYCVLEYSTHAIGGLSENDFICAAKVDNVL